MSRLTDFARYVLPPVATVVILLVAAQILIPILRIQEFLVPTPREIISLIFSSKIDWVSNSEVTLSEALGGFILAVVVGIPVGILTSVSKTVRLVLEPILLAAQVAPKIALVPVFFVWLGLVPLPRILTVFLVCFFPIVIDTETGLASVEPEMVDMVRSFNSSRLELVEKVSFPNALPSIFSGLKIAITLAMVGALVAEFVSSSSGLGFIILSSELTLNTPAMFAATTVLVLISLLLYGAVLLIERLAIPWRR